MGLLIAKFRKKESTFDVLTKLENEIVSIEEFQTRTRETQRKIVFRFLILALLIFVATAFFFYTYFSQISQNQKLLWSIPLITSPLVIWLIKKLLSWYYNRKLEKNKKYLIVLKEKKKKILENVMEKETYKVAKEILDKFGNEGKKPAVSPYSTRKMTPFPTTPTSYSSVIRQRIVAEQSSLRGRPSFGLPNTPQAQRLPLPAPNPRSINVLQTPRPLAITSSPGPVLPRSILPRDRTVLDKMVDYLVGDGPSNRYALICQKCSSHNGMALKEEFEYLAFRCCYCNTLNPARKMRPVGPKFDSPAIAPQSTGSESSNSERNSDSDSDSEQMPVVEEPRSDSPDTARTSDFERISDSELPPSEGSQMDVDGSSSAKKDTAETNDLEETAHDTIDNL